MSCVILTNNKGCAPIEPRMTRKTSYLYYSSSISSLVVKFFLAKTLLKRLRSSRQVQISFMFHKRVQRLLLAISYTC